jgi:HSP20 family molecular chaperone IbpA
MNIQRKDEKEEKKETEKYKYYMSERSYGKFFRSFRLPQSLNLI